MKITKELFEHFLLLWSLNRQTRNIAVRQTFNSVIFQTLLPISHFKNHRSGIWHNPFHSWLCA